MLLPLLLALAPGSVVVSDWLVLAPTGRTGRRPFAPSAVFEKHLVARDLAPPKVGEALTGESGTEQKWVERKAGEDGGIGDGVGWAYARVESAEARMVLAKLSGASRLFVNGAGFVGDSYGYGFGGSPVALRKGANDVYVGGVRGSFRLELVDAPVEIIAGSWDHVVPDVVRQEPRTYVSVGVLAWNASDSAREITLQGLESVWTTDTGAYSEVAQLAPGAAWRFTVPLTNPHVPAEQKTVIARVVLSSRDAVVEERIEVPVRARDEAQRVPFVSGIDGSLQTYALLPQKDSTSRATPPVLLSLHGASVDALNQARAYAQKESIAVVCPTNRRPYGFDWQDWGRQDAYEVLDDFLASTDLRMPLSDRAGSKLSEHERLPFRRSQARIVLTGHSMGGHGTWSLAANDADAFDAIGPSAGWASFDSYGGRPDGALKSLWNGADFASRTEDLATNLVPLPTFVLHGTADDNVPASEAHDMIARLEALGAKPKSHFQEGAGHWWDGDLSAGADCVDHPGFLALFDQIAAGDAFAFDWTSADPGVDSRHRWVEVLQPLVYGRPFRVTSKRGREPRSIEIETDNVRVLEITRANALLQLSIDGHAAARAWAVETWELTAQGWSLRAEPLTGKTPERCGPFKRAFDHRFVLVYGTTGDDAEDRELFERARYDQATWWYRANATAALMSDREFLASESIGRNVILYGNRDTNFAWPTLVPDGGPIDARRGSLRLGERTWKGDDLGAVFVVPRADDEVGLVGAFADTGPRGSRLGYMVAPFVSGVGYPDYALFSRAILSSGDGGVLAAGWFDRNWAVDPKQFAVPE